MKTFIAAKIHDISVTDKSIEYHGSVAISSVLMETAGIEPYEQVHVINLANGNRWVTYAIPAHEGTFSLNGGGARLGEIGDRCVLLSYRQEKAFSGASVVFCTHDNQVKSIDRYKEPQHATLLSRSEEAVHA